MVSTRLRPVSISERDELEPIIVDNPEAIEKGFKIVSRQLQTPSGPLDLLAISEDGTLVVVELKNEPTDGHLGHGLRYYDWCRQNLAWIAQAHADKKFPINVKALPRLYLVAPSFTDTVKQVAKYIAVGIDLKLFEYQAVKNEKNELGVICKELDLGEPPTPPSITSVEEKMNYFKDGKVKNLFETIRAELREKGIEEKPISGLTITFWYNGKRFMWMAPRQKYFVANALIPGEKSWGGLQSISTRNQWNKFNASQIKKYLEYLDSTE
ncbi:MAG: DUF91 domain-containing protein [Chloroflexi bacterium]|nr:DUF91 domain-containing protein [Chloroflexota bacterium]